MYKLEVIGFQKFKRYTCRTIEGARVAFKEARAYTYQELSFGKETTCRFTQWELWRGSEMIKSGEFERGN